MKRIWRARGVGHLEEKTVADFVSGAITGDTFLRVTASFWRDHAWLLLWKWQRELPPSVDVDDIVQLLMLHVVLSRSLIDSRRGNPATFMVWHVIRRAQREMHKLRGARIHGNDARNPGRPEVSFAEFTECDVLALGLDDAA